jgi:hypothetical protein
MCVQPQASELFGLLAGIYLLIEEVSHGRIIESDTGDSYGLLDCLEVVDVEQVIRGRDSKAADLCRAVTAEAEL